VSALRSEIKIGPRKPDQDAIKFTKCFGSVSTVQAVADAFHIVVDALQITLDGL
jgi:hypothetical protein